ncbi:MAG: toll/interleukin-1 receptor domain-containing protein [Desulfobacteraceae bacterium]|nr:toll/interleukin-1 receptor domain-containing protein [Desulfobacteraceae bacterium]
MKEKKVFISYVKEDADTAKKLYNDLKIKGVEPWMNNKNILPGQNWKMEIERAIRKNCSNFLLLLSSNSISKKCYEHKQMRIALDNLDYYFNDNNSFIIPVRLDDCDITGNDRLRNLQCVDIFPSYENGLEKIIDVILPEKNDSKHCGEYEKNNYEIREQKVDSLKIVLPYLIDRHEQINKLESMVKNHIEAETSQRPLTCIIHGEAAGHAHDKFLEHHIPYYWPRIQPSRSEKAAAPKFIDFEWRPSACDPIELKEKIISGIYHRVQNSFSCDYREVSTAINKRYMGRPILMCTFVYTDDWERHGKEIISSFNEFWNDWPPRPKEDILVACLVIKYLKNKTNRSKNILNYIFNTGTNYYVRINEKIRQTLKSCYANFEIPELLGIKISDVYEWTRLKEVKRICEQKDLSPETIIHEIYESVNIENRIPMVTLAEELKERIFNNKRQ